MEAASPPCSWPFTPDLTLDLFIHTPPQTLKMLACVSHHFNDLAIQAMFAEIGQFPKPVTAIKLNEENRNLLLISRGALLTSLVIHDPKNNKVLDLRPDFYPSLISATISRMGIDISKFMHCKQLTSLKLLYCNLELKEIREIKALPCFTALKTLNLSGNLISDFVIKNLLDPDLPLSIRALSLNDIYVTPLGISHIINHRIAESLLTLDFRKNKVKTGSAMDILKNCTSLTSLDLSNNSINGFPKMDLKVYGHLSKLTELNLSCNRIGNAGIEFFTSCPMPDLVTLKVAKNGITNIGTRSLACTTNLNNLRSLDFSRNVSKNALDFFGSSEDREKIEELYLSSCKLSVNTLNKFFKANHLSNLSVLDLSSNDINDNIILMIGNSGYSSQLHCLNLSWNGFHSIDPLKSLLFSNITQLSISGNRIGDKGLHQITKAQSLANVTNLDLSYCKVTAKGTRYLTKATFKNLSYLAISHNNLKDACSKYLSALNKLITLIILEINLTDVGARHFANSLLTNRLTLLDMRKNPIDQETFNVLQQSKLLEGCEIKADITPAETPENTH
jgi:Leucine-rich repeat (LRR) protein